MSRPDTSLPRKPFWKRKRWIAVAALWLVVSYVLSYGPMCWLVWRHPWLETAVGIVYWPLDMLVMHGPDRVSTTLLWYVDLWMIDGRSSAT